MPLAVAKQEVAGNRNEAHQKPRSGRHAVPPGCLRITLGIQHIVHAGDDQRCHRSWLGRCGTCGCGRGSGAQGASVSLRHGGAWARRVCFTGRATLPRRAWVALDSSRGFRYIPALSRRRIAPTARHTCPRPHVPFGGLMDLGPRAGDGKDRDLRSPSYSGRLRGAVGSGLLDRRTGNLARRGPNAPGRYPRACPEDLETVRGPD